MSLTIQLPELLEQQMRRRAAGKGLSVENYVAQVLGADTAQDRLEKNEQALDDGELLRLVNQGVSPEIWVRFHELDALRKSEKLTNQEYQELLEIVDLIESAHAERVRLAAVLAERRGVPLERLLIDLGVKKARFE
ncbi:MAG: hypothetical protein KF852_19255 [Saprospiraceae bacterium]|nr:hypothetical protein [Saprospiraceae bacterium]